MLELFAGAWNGIEPGCRDILAVVFKLLLFFTLFFHAWRTIRPHPFVRVMLVRTYSWWMMTALVVIFCCTQPWLGYIGLALLSAGALRELTGKIDRRYLPPSLKCLAFFALIVQFVLAAKGHLVWTLAWIPAGAFVFASIVCLLYESIEIVMTGPAVLVWALLLTGYGLSHLVLLIALPAPHGEWPNAQGLLLYYLFLTQFNDILQFLWGASLGRHKIAPLISPNKTWEGLLGGIGTSMLIAYTLRGVTPFSGTQSWIVGALLSLTGFLGDLTLSAFKRTLGIKDMGSLIPGHGGLLDRIDSITLSALAYFYLIYFWFFN